MRSLIRLCLAALPLLAFAAPARADAFDDCETAAFAEIVYEGEETVPGASGFECVEVERKTFATNGQTVHIRLLRDVDVSQQQVGQYGQEAYLALETALAKYASLRSFTFKNVSVVLMDPNLPWPPKELGVANMASPTGECVIRVFSGNHDNIPFGDDAINLFANTVAHELFHCVQYWNYAKQVALASEGGRWWAEASAELMANLVFPDATRLQRQGKRFNDAIRAKSLTDIAYPGVVFMSWLWNRDQARIFALLEAMPTDQTGSEAQQAALLEIVEDEEFQQFARDWADGKIMAPSGAAFPAPEGQMPQTVDKDMNVALDGPPLAIQFEQLTITKGIYTALEYDGGTIVARQRAAAGGEWGEVPLTVGPEECPGQLDLVLVRMPTREMNQAERIEFKKVKPCEECVVTEVRDQCLVGKWQMDHDSLLNFLNYKTDKNTRFVSSGGKAIMVFDAQGEAQMVVEGVEIQAVIDPPGGPQTFVTVKANGIDLGKWSGEKGTLNYCAGQSGITFEAKVEIPDQFENTQSIEGMMQDSSFGYVCGETLNMQYSGPLELGDYAPRWTFTRIK